MAGALALRKNTDGDIQVAREIVTRRGAEALFDSSKLSNVGIDATPGTHAIRFSREATTVPFTAPTAAIDPQHEVVRAPPTATALHNATPSSPSAQTRPNPADKMSAPPRVRVTDDTPYARYMPHLPSHAPTITLTY